MASFLIGSYRGTFAQAVLAIVIAIVIVIVIVIAIVIANSHSQKRRHHMVTSCYDRIICRLCLLHAPLEYTCRVTLWLNNFKLHC